MAMAAVQSRVNFILSRVPTQGTSIQMSMFPGGGSEMGFLIAVFPGSDWFRSGLGFVSHSGDLAAFILFVACSDPLYSYASCLAFGN
jgi:hypothetical protein